jgi:hypothetical protein
MFMLFGRGGRNFWIIRIGILVLVLTAGAVFHYHGAAYWTVRGLYYALIAGFILTAVWRNKSRQRGGLGTRGPGTFSGRPYQGGGMQPPFGGQYPPSQPHGDLPPSVPPAEPSPSTPVGGRSMKVPPATTPPATVRPFPEVAPVEHSVLSGPGQEPGWYPDPSDPMARHYWDGANWSHRLKWDGTTWVPA